MNRRVDVLDGWIENIESVARSISYILIVVASTRSQSYQSAQTKRDGRSGRVVWTYAALLLNGLSELLTISSMPSGDEMGNDKARARFQAKMIMSVEYCIFAGRGIRRAV